MAIPDNKERIAITLTKESMEALKKAAKDNFRRPSDEVEALIVKYIINNIDILKKIIYNTIDLYTIVIRRDK